jgi:hypothetical protein
MDPNSQNQLWSRWTFTVLELGRHVPQPDVELNVARWLRQGFGSVGTVRVQATARGYRIEVLVEGRPAHDQAFVALVREQFRRHFVEKGWGPVGAVGFVSARVVAGDKQDGRPRDQLVILPSIPLEVPS